MSSVAGATALLPQDAAGCAVDFLRVDVLLYAVGGRWSNAFAASLAALVVVAGSLVLGCASSGDDKTRLCTEMRDHVVEVRLSQSRGSDELGHPIDLAPHRAAMKQALGANYIEECRRELSSAQIKCELSAADSDAASACIRLAR